MFFGKGSWWVIAFCCFTCIGYFHFIKGKKSAIKELTLRLEEMERAKCFAQQRACDLKLRIASQCDPAWIEMILMRDLGVVPEGFLKVHFKK